MIDSKIQKILDKKIKDCLDEIDRLEGALKDRD